MSVVDTRERAHRVATRLCLPSAVVGGCHRSDLIVTSSGVEDVRCGWNSFMIVAARHVLANSSDPVLEGQVSSSDCRCACSQPSREERQWLGSALTNG